MILQIAGIEIDTDQIRAMTTNHFEFYNGKGECVVRIFSHLAMKRIWDNRAIATLEISNRITMPPYIEINEYGSALPTCRYGDIEPYLIEGLFAPLLDLACERGFIPGKVDHVYT